MKVLWTENALTDLQSIHSYIARRSRMYADSMVTKLLDHARLLEAQPRIGPVIPEFDEREIRELFRQPYRILYTIQEDRAEILAVVHSARQQTPRIPPPRPPDDTGGFPSNV